MLSKRSFIALGVSLLLVLFASDYARAQSDESKFEVGIQFSALGRGPGFWFEDTAGVGGGGRLTFNLTKYIALEGELNYFPSTSFYNVRRFQGQFGVKSGVKFNRFGFFGKVRPGFIDTSYDYPIFCIQGPCPPFRVERTNFSTDVGGVTEFYPARRITVRFDVGDTIVSRRPEIIPLLRDGSFFSLYVPPKQITHNFQLGAGIGFRF